MVDSFSITRPGEVALDTALQAWPDLTCLLPFSTLPAQLVHGSHLDHAAHAASVGRRAAERLLRCAAGVLARRHAVLARSAAILSRGGVLLLLEGTVLAGRRGLTWVPAGCSAVGRLLTGVPALTGAVRGRLSRVSPWRAVAARLACVDKDVAAWARPLKHTGPAAADCAEARNCWLPGRAVCSFQCEGQRAGDSYSEDTHIRWPAPVGSMPAASNGS